MDANLHWWKIIKEVLFENQFLKGEYLGRFSLTFIVLPFLCAFNYTLNFNSSVADLIAVLLLLDES